MTKYKHVLPHDEEAERVLLGTLIQERNTLNEVRELLIPEVFYNNFHKTIFRAILKIDARGERPDFVTVSDEVKKIMGDRFLPYEYTVIASSYGYDPYQYAKLINDKYKRRRLYEIAWFLNENSFSEVVDISSVLAEAHQKLETLYDTSATTISTIKDAIEKVYKRIELNMTGKGAYSGVPTGFKEYDNQSGGLHKSDLIVMAGETSIGKTSLAISMVMNSGSRVAFYSMEMKKEQLAARMIAIESGVPTSRILYGKLSDSQLMKVDKGVSQLVDKPVFFDDKSTSNIDDILASIYRMKRKHDIDGVVVDYLQILNVNMRGVGKEQQMGEVARRLKNLAKELDIWIIALSQLNRDALHPVPTLNRLRDSGQIAEAADVVMLIYRPEVYGKNYPAPFQQVDPQNTAMIDVAKGRNIGLHKFICGFDKETTRFYNISRAKLSGKKENQKGFPF